MLSQPSTEKLNGVFSILGLSSTHTLTYLSCLKIGSGSASTIAKIAGLPRSSTYDLLRDLSKKGLISEIKYETKLMYSAVSPEILDDLVDIKKKEIELNEKVLKTEMPLMNEAFRKSKANFPNIRFYQGETGVKTVYYDSLKAKEILCICQGDTQPTLSSDPEYLKDYIDEVIYRKIKTKELLEDTNAAREYQEKYNNYINQIIITPRKSEQGFGHVDKQIYSNKVAYISHDNLIGVIIEDETLYLMEKNQFETLWNIYYKIKQG